MLVLLLSLAQADLTIPGMKRVDSRVVVEGAPPPGTSWVVYPMGSGGDEHRELEPLGGDLWAASYYSISDTRLIALPEGTALPDCPWSDDHADRERCEQERDALAERLPRSDVRVAAQRDVPEDSPIDALETVYAFRGVEDGVVLLDVDTRPWREADVPVGPPPEQLEMLSLVAERQRRNLGLTGLALMLGALAAVGAAVARGRGA